jgi:hypothetical protein
MLFTTALPSLPAGPRRAQAADVSQRPAPADWAFGYALTDRQRDDARNTVAWANGRHGSRRFTGAGITDFGALA